MNQTLNPRRIHILFWLSFGLLNTLLFLTRFIADNGRSPFFPFTYFFKGDWYTRLKVFLIRPGLDVFRINVELVLLTVLLFLFRNQLKRFKWLFIPLWVFYFLLLLYSIYHGAMEGIYQTEPLFFNDLNLMKTGFTIISSESWLILVGIICGFLALIGLTFVLVKSWFKQTLQIRWTKLEKGIWLFILFLVVLNFKYKTTITTRNAVQPISVMFMNNINRSKDAAFALKAIHLDSMALKIPYQNLTLQNRPDIYLIIIESYGRIVFTDTVMQRAVEPTLEHFQTKLAAQNWHIASTFSASPAFAGKSWVAYSSLIFGFNFKNQGTYDALFSTPEIYDYPSWPAVMRHFGYKSYRLNTLPPADLIDVPWKKFSQFYAIDEWIRYEDLNYEGKRYGFGPAPPDQFGFNKALELIKAEWQGKTKPPVFFFFLNQNTHHPFEAPSEAVEDWKSLNNPKEKTTAQGIGFLGNPNREKYINSINYEFDFLLKYLTSEADSNAIFLIMGDHQPPFVADPKDGMSTPVHILSKNPRFINALVNCDFVNGMTPEPEVKYHHSGLYSAFMHALFSLDSSAVPPPVFPNGFDHEHR